MLLVYEGFDPLLLYVVTTVIIRNLKTFFIQNLYIFRLKIIKYLQNF